VAYTSLEEMLAGEKKMRRIDSGIMKKDLASDKSHYDPLDWEFDDLNLSIGTCRNGEIMKFHDHVEVEEMKTHYQSLSFMIHPDTNDVVMDLDNIVQVQ